MSIVNLGNQYITFDYRHPAKAEDFNILLRGAVKPGIYSGGIITPLGGADISISPFIAYLYSGDNKLVKVETRAAVTLSVTETTPVISITYPWLNVSENWLDFNQRMSGSSPIANEVCLGECVFTLGVITSIDYSDKDWGLQYDGTVNPLFNSDQVDGCDVETILTTSSNSKIPTSKAVADFVFENLVIGSSIKTELSYIPISSSHPWLCMSLSDRTLDVANYNQDFVDALRARKLTYDEFGASPVTAFTGAWGAGADANKFTLDNNATNIAMLAELAEDWLFASSPVTGWRILGSGGFEFNITGITTATRIITVNLDSESPAGATSIEIYLNRVYRDATKVRHFSEAGNAAYQAGGTSKFNGLRRRDQFQAWQLGQTISGTTYYSTGSANEYEDQVFFANYSRMLQCTNTQGDAAMGKAVNDGTNGEPRTGLETRAKSGTRYEYVYTGSYTA